MATPAKKRKRVSQEAQDSEDEKFDKKKKLTAPMSKAEIAKKRKHYYDWQHDAEKLADQVVEGARALKGLGPKLEKKARKK